MLFRSDEWNVTRVSPDEYSAKCRVLEDHCRAVGRDPATIGRSLMVPIIIGRTQAEMSARLARTLRIFPRLPEDAAGWRAASFLFGSPAEIVKDLRRWRDLGIGRVMLQLLDQEDLDAIALVGREVKPALA